MRTFIITFTVMLIAGSVRADFDTIGPDGINSQVTGLDGTGTIIGMLDVGRPGKPGKDLPLYVNTLVNPTQVYAGNGIDGANSFWVVDDPPNDMRGTHPMQVAGVMISSSDGVAKATSLHAGTSDRIAGDVSTNIAANRLARISGIRAINVSVGRDGTPNGLSEFTKYIDWSSRANNVLYVVSAADDPEKVGVPEDNYNGIGVGASQRLNGGIAGSYLQAWPDNIITNLGGNRTAIDILAPGFDFSLTTQNNGANSENGTSYAAPHVTGAVALLDQYGNFQVNLGNPRFAGEHVQHEVFKAVILNSADKMAGVH